MVKIILAYLKYFIKKCQFGIVLSCHELCFFPFGQETKADIIARENKKRLIAKEEQREEQKWNALSPSIEKEMKRNLSSGMKKLEEFLKSCKINSVKVQAEKVGLTACLTAWKEHCRAEGVWGVIWLAYLDELERPKRCDDDGLSPAN